MSRTFVIGEIGINHSGNINIAKQLIDVAVEADCDAVKFQKRSVSDVYSPEELDVFRESPFGTTNREQKNGLEFGKEEYDEIDIYCKEKGMVWFSSAWDLKSQEFLKQYDLKYNKVASAMLTIKPMLEMIAKEHKYTFISTGMCIMEEIEEAVDIFKSEDCPFSLLHCNSSYPSEDEDANLRMIQILKDVFRCDVGFSDHARGLQISLFAVALGAKIIERHITLDRSAYGSDNAASLEKEGLIRLVRDIRIFEKALGNDIKTISKQEQEIRNKLSNPYWYGKLKNV